MNGHMLLLCKKQIRTRNMAKNNEIVLKIPSIAGRLLYWQSKQRRLTSCQQCNTDQRLPPQKVNFQQQNYDTDEQLDSTKPHCKLLRVKTFY